MSCESFAEGAILHHWGILMFFLGWKICQLPIQFQQNTGGYCVCCFLGSCGAKDAVRVPY